MPAALTDLLIAERSNVVGRITAQDIVNLVLSSTPTIIAGRVNAAGTLLKGAGATVSLVSTGIYQVTFDTPQPDANYPIMISPEGIAKRDDYFLDYFNVTTAGFQVRGTEQDNGGAAGVFLNMGFSFSVIEIP